MSTQHIFPELGPRLGRRVNPNPRILEAHRVVGASKVRHPAQAAYRMLRTRLLRRTRPNNWRTIGIIAAGPGEGKTLTAINLAISMAGEPGQPVVLADFDLRHPTMAQTLGIRPDVTLVEYLRDPTVTLNDIMVRIDVDGLFLLLNDQTVDNSSDLLSSPRARRLLDELHATLPNALLVLDLPPVLAADDALAIAPSVDAFLFVVAEGQTTREDLREVKELLEELNVVGTVLNKSIETDANRYYYY